MSRVNIKKLESGGKVESKKPNLLKTAKGNIDFDKAKVNILDGAKKYYEESGADSQGLGTYLQQVGHRIDEISKGNVTEISAARKFVGNTSIPDYSNFKQKTKGNIFSGKSSVWDEDALGNLASSYVLDRLSSFDPYEENEINKTDGERKTYSYLTDRFKEDLAKTVFKGGDFDNEYWKNLNESDRAINMANSLISNIDRFNKENNNDYSKFDFDTVHGYQKADDYMTAYKDAIQYLSQGKLDEEAFNKLRKIGLGSVRNWLRDGDENKIDSTTFGEYTIDGGYNPYSQSYMRANKDGAQKHFTKREDGTYIPTTNFIFDNQFDNENYGSVIMDGTKYKTLSDYTRQHPDAINSISDGFHEVYERAIKNRSISPYVNTKDKNSRYAYNSNLRKDYTFTKDGLSYTPEYRTDLTGAFPIASSAGLRIEGLDTSSNLNTNTYSDRKVLITDKDNNQHVVNIINDNGLFKAVTEDGSKTFNLGKYNENFDPTSSTYADKREVISAKDYSNENLKNFDDALEAIYNMSNYDYDETALANLIDRLKTDEVMRSDGQIRLSKDYLKDAPHKKTLEEFINNYGFKDGNFHIIKDTKLVDYINSKRGDKKLNWKPKNNKPTSKIDSYMSAQGRNPNDYKKGGRIKRLQQGGDFKPADTGLDIKRPSDAKSDFRVKSDDFSAFNLSDYMSGYEKARLYSSVADVGSMALALVPGANIAGAGIGAAASVTRFGSKVADPDAKIGWGDVGELGVDLGLDALSLIGPMKAAKAVKSVGALSKILKNLPLAGAAISVAGITSNYDDILKSLSKLTTVEGWKSMSTSDLNKLTTLLGGIVSGKALVKTVPNTKFAFTKGKELKDTQLTRKIFLKNRTSTSPKSTVKIDVDGKQYDVEVSKSLSEARQGTKSSQASSFNDKVRQDINKQIDSYVSVDGEGKSTLSADAPDWVKSIYSKGKNGNEWNFETSKSKIGLIPFKRKYIVDINSDGGTHSGELRSIFSSNNLYGSNRIVGSDKYIMNKKRIDKATDYKNNKAAQPKVEPKVSRLNKPKEPYVYDPTASNYHYRPIKPTVDTEVGGLVHIPKVRGNANSIGSNGIIHLNGKGQPQLPSAERLGLPEPKIIPENRRLDKAPIVTPYNGKITTQPVNVNNNLNIQVQRDLASKMKVGEIISYPSNTSKGKMSYYEKTPTGLVEVTDPNVIKSYIDNNRLKALAIARDRKRLGREIGEKREAREILARDRAEIAERNRLEKEVRDAQNAIPYTPSKKISKPKQSKKTKKQENKDTKRRLEGGVLKLALGDKIPYVFHKFDKPKSLNEPFTVKSLYQPSNLNSVLEPKKLPRLITESKPYMGNIDTTGVFNYNIGKPDVINTNVIPSNNRIVESGSTGNATPTNTHFNVNPSSVLALGTLGVGLNMQRKAYNEAKKYQPSLLDAPQINARTPHGNLLIEQAYKKQALDNLRRINKNVTSDGDINNALAMEAMRMSNDLNEKGSLANDQEIKRTREIFDRTEAQNLLARTEVANANNAAITNSINMKHDLKSQMYGNKWSHLINPYLSEVRNNMLRKEALGDQLNLESSNRLLQSDTESQLNNLRYEMIEAQKKYTDTSIPFTQSKTYRDLEDRKRLIMNKMYSNLETNKKKYISGFKKGGRLNS